MLFVVISIIIIDYWLAIDEILSIDGGSILFQRLLWLGDKIHACLGTFCRFFEDKPDYFSFHCIKMFDFELICPSKNGIKNLVSEETR